jgi:hypothetical protein
VDIPESLVSALRALHVDAPDLRSIEGLVGTPYWRLRVPGSEALVIWQGLRDQAGATGFWPVIIGDYSGVGSDVVIDRFLDDARSLHEATPEQLQFMGAYATPAEVLAAAQAWPFERWLERQRDPDYQVAEHERQAKYFEGFEGAAGLAKLHREWAASWREQPRWQFVPENYPFPPTENRNPPQAELHCLQRYNSNGPPWSIRADSVAILLVPTRFAWEVPAFLGFTTRENELLPQVHVAALRWLFDRFGAELVGLEPRVMEVIPRARPQTPVDALRVAADTCVYSSCPATSQNECASVSELAVYLMESPYWSFSWP